MKVENLTLLGDTVLVEPISQEQTESGLYIKQDFAPKLAKGKILVVSKSDKCQDVKIDDIVCYHKFAGKPIKVGDTKYLLVSINDLEAILDD